MILNRVDKVGLTENSDIWAQTNKVNELAVQPGVM